LFVTLEAHAAGVAEGAKLLTLEIRPNGWAIVCMNLNKGGPGCGIINNNCLAFDSQTNVGKSQLSLITAAFLAGRSADLYGTDVCTPSVPDVEQLDRFVMR
jgi:hypothetical protein